MKHPKEEITYVMLKPDGVRKGLIGEVIKRFEQRDLKIVALEMFKPEHDKIDNHYPKSEEWITRLGNKTISTYEKYGYDLMKDFGTNEASKIGPEIRKWLIDYMNSAPLVKMVVKGVHAVDVVRKVAGDTMPYKADMGTIRGDFSMSAQSNLVHASDSLEAGENEIKRFFKSEELFSYGKIDTDLIYSEHKD